MAHEISRRGVLLAGLATGAMAATGGHPPAAAMATSTARGASRPLALAGVTVVDVAGSRLRPDTTVLVRGERIITVGRRDEVGIPHGAAVVELPGKYVIPGLWDMHTHSFGSERISPALYVAAGVTSVREMAGTPLIHQWRHHFKWKRVSMAAGLCYGSRGGGAALAFHYQVGAYNTDTLIGALEELRRFLGGQKATLLWDGLPAHRSHAMLPGSGGSGPGWWWSRCPATRRS
jgi:hypothetical protein